MTTTTSTAVLRALALVPKFTAPLSIVCSIFIVVEVLIEHRRNKGKVASRALLAMSIIDAMSSFGWFLSTWVAPSDTPDILYAVGNTASCTFQGFLLQLAIGAPMYNSVLAIYYLLMIRFSWSERQLSRIEPFVHALVMIFAVGTSILGIPLGLYNNIRSVCWIVGLPKDCRESTFYPVGDNPAPCERGHNAWLYGTVLFYAPLWVCIFIAVGSMVAIWYHVRSLRKRNRMYDPSSASIVQTGRRSISFTQTSVPQQEVAIQAILYTIAFIAAWLPSTIWSLSYYFSMGAQPTVFDLMSGACEPLQGFWNFLVFIRPRTRLRAQLRHWLCCGPKPSEDTRSGSTLGGRGSSAAGSTDGIHRGRCGGHGYSAGVSGASNLQASLQKRIRRLSNESEHRKGDDDDDEDPMSNSATASGKDSSELFMNKEDVSPSEGTTKGNNEMAERSKPLIDEDGNENTTRKQEVQVIEEAGNESKTAPF